MQGQAKVLGDGLGRVGFGWQAWILLFFAAFLMQSPGPAWAIENKPFIPPVTASPPAGTKAVIDADQIVYDLKRKVGRAKGHVRIHYGVYELEANWVEVDKAAGSYKADGKIVIREPNGNVLEAESADIRNKFRDALLSEMTALLTNDAVIKAVRARRISGDTLVFDKASYSVCKDCQTDSGQPVWELQTDQTIEDLKGHNITHIHPRLKIAGQEVLPLPNLHMPDPSVTRRTGFLLPEFKTGSIYGAGLVTPYFMALSPSTDVTLRPMWTTRQGPVADVEWRQALENGSYRVRGMGVYQFNDQPGDEKGPWRGAVQTNGQFRANTDWTYGWNGTFATDRNFLGSYGFDGRNYAVNNVYATGIWDQTYINAEMLNFRSQGTYINPNAMPYAMPFVSGETIMRDIPVGGQFDLTWNAYSIHRAAAVDHADPANYWLANSDQAQDQTRATTALNWHRKFYNASGLVFTPFGNLRGDMLMTNNLPSGGGSTSDSTARVLPEAGIDMRWPFVASLPYGQSVISPVMQVVASANEGNSKAFGNEDAITLNFDHSSLFLQDRFTGMDRYEGGTRADMGLTYSLIGHNGGFIRGSLGESIHLAGQNSFTDGSGLADNYSDIVGAIMFQPWSSFNVSYEGRMRNDFSGFNRQEVSAGLDFDRFSANVAYLDFAAEPDYGQLNAVHWVSGDSKIKLDKGWNLFGGLTYDFTTSTFVRKTAGVEFDCKCMNFKAYYLGWTDSLTQSVDNRLMLSVEFATLGKTGLGVGF